MKGPGMRLDLDVRRIWRCGVCQTVRHTPGRITAVDCHFCQNHPPMRLVEPQRADRHPVPPPDLYIGLHPDDVDAPAFVPAHLREPVAPPAESPDAVATTMEVTETTTVTVEVTEPTPEAELPSDALSETVKPTTPENAPATETTETGQPRKPRRKKKRRRKS